MKTQKRLVAGLVPALAVLLLFAGTARADLEGAEALRAAGKYTEAIPLYKEVLKGDEKNPKAMYGLSFCLTEVGKTEQFPDSLWGARQILDRLVLLAPDDAEVRYLSGYNAYLLAPRDASFMMDLRNVAIRELTRSVEARPEHWESRYYLARALRDQGRLAEATPVFEKAIALDPGRLEAYPDLALALYGLGRFDDCIKTAGVLLEKSPSYHYAHKIIGDAWAGVPDFAKAEAEYLLGAGAEPGNGIWADSLWLLFQKNKDTERATQVFGGLVEQHPDLEVARKYLALTYANMKWHKDAALHFKALTERFPLVPWYFQGLAEAEDALGNEAAAVSGYLEALRLKPDWTNPFLPLRERYEKAKGESDFRGAVDLLRRIAACKPHARTHAWIQWEISEGSRQLGDMEGTIAALRKAMELDPIEPRFHNSLGLLFRTLERFDEAVVEFKKALDLQPGYMYTLENLGATFQMVHKDREAIEWFETGLGNAQEQHAWAGDDIELKSERGFDIFKFSYFLHEYLTLEEGKGYEGEKGGGGEGGK